jgi:endonuclease/exonuclease/phosphatase family metal-dependent hydrolase
MSYNVNLFQLYSWSKEPPTQNQVFEFIERENIDIVCLQEFYLVNDKFNEKQAKSQFDGNMHVGYIIKRQNSAYGLATYSRYPIINSGEIKFENSANACIYTDLQVGKDTIRVYNNHLQSLRLKERNISFLLNQNFRKETQKMDEIKDISFRFRDAVQKRAKQVEIVTKHMLSSPYPAIVCGDFNDSPISYNYRQMRRNLNDAFIEAGAGVGHTYKGFFPSFRIDYVLYSQSFKATSYSSPRVNYSDHYPVVATLRRID